MKRSALLLSCCLLTASGFAQLPIQGGPFLSTSFMPTKNDTTGVYPHGVVLADFNGDGKPDILVSRGSSGMVSILPNNSSGGDIILGRQHDLIATGTNHEGAAAGDLDGDGLPDIVVTNSINLNSVSVWRNTSTTSIFNFSNKQDLEVTNSSHNVAIGDLDGDGKPDLAIVNSGGNQVSFYRNTSTPGNITFAPTRTDITVGPAPYGVAIGDLNGDGKADLVVSTQGVGAALYALQNNSVAGTFSFGTPVGIASGSGFVVTLGDMDGDGKPDIAEAAAYTTVIVRNLSTNGSFAFAAAQQFNNNSYVEGLVISDLDGDGKQDLVTANRFSDNFSAFHNTSSSGSISFDNPVNYATDKAPISIAAGDLNGDGQPDVVTANSSSPTVSVLRNLIGAGVAPAVTGITPSSGNKGTLVTITGLNLTGTTAVSFGGIKATTFTVNSATSVTAVVGPGANGDVLVTTPYGVAAYGGFAYLGPLMTSFTPKVGVAGTIVTISGYNFTNATGVNFGSVAAASFTVNSATTITATLGAGASGPVTVTTGNGTATLPGFVFGVPTLDNVNPISGLPGSSVVLTGTNFGAAPADNIVYFGAAQAKVTAASSTQLTVLVPTGATYQPVSVTTNGLTAFSPQPFHSLFATDSSRTINSRSFTVALNTGIINPASVAVGDIDGDGKPDVVTANGLTQLVSVQLNRSTPGTIALGSKIDMPTLSTASKVVIGDIDGDGKLDIAAISINYSTDVSTLSVFRNTSVSGSLSFDSRKDFIPGNGSYDLILADMNGDGKPDVLVGSGNAGIFSIFPNNSSAAGGISFAPRVDYTALNHSEYLVAADLDNDGRPDLVTANFSGSSISVYRNQSAGGSLSLGFPTNYSLPAQANPTRLASGDLDGDGLSDIGVPNYSLGTVSLFRNNSTPGNPTLSLAQSLIRPLPATLNFADLNGDGKIDICMGQQETGKVTVFENTSAAVGLVSFASNVDFVVGPYDTFSGAADIDGDGKPDLLAGTTFANTLCILRNTIGDQVTKLESIAPDSAVKGQTVTIKGSGFTDVTKVLLGGLPVDNYTVIDNTTIQAVVSSGNSGKVLVATTTGGDSLDGFYFIPEITPNGTTTLCKTGSVSLSSTALSGNQWYKDGIALPGSTANTLTVSADGAYTTKVTANGITTAADSGLTLSVLGDTTPVITRNADNDLVSSSAIDNQWFLDGNPLPGATQPIYHPSNSGSYTVQVTTKGCSSDVSTPYVTILKGIIDLGNGQYVNLYPNPVQNSLKIYWNLNSMSQLDVVVTDLQGQQLKSFANATNGTVLDLSGLPRGVYYVKIYSNDSTKINRTVKILKVQ